MRRHPVDLELRLFKRMWTGSRTDKGYGYLILNGRKIRVHRLAYRLFVGPLPGNGLVPDHTCETKHCANPEHIEWITVRENLLKGDTLAARWAKRTHCGKGHPFDEVNTYWRKDGGGRMCRQCAREYQQRRKSRLADP